MTYINTALAVIALLCSGIAIAISWKIWQEMRLIHQRLHRSETQTPIFEQNLATCSRIVTQLRASASSSDAIDQIRCSSQHGEELTLWQLSDFKLDGVFVEIGA